MLNAHNMKWRIWSFEYFPQPDVDNVLKSQLEICSIYVDWQPTWQASCELQPPAAVWTRGAGAERRLDKLQQWLLTGVETGGQAILVVLVHSNWLSTCRLLLERPGPDGTWGRTSPALSQNLLIIPTLTSPVATRVPQQSYFLQLIGMLH